MGCAGARVGDRQCTQAGKGHAGASIGEAGGALGPEWGQGSMRARMVGRGHSEARGGSSTCRGQSRGQGACRGQSRGKRVHRGQSRGQGMHRDQSGGRGSHGGQSGRWGLGVPIWYPISPVWFLISPIWYPVPLSGILFH